MLPWALPCKWKPFVSQGKTSTLEFGCYHKHPSLSQYHQTYYSTPRLYSVDGHSSSYDNRWFYIAKPTNLSSDATMIVLSWVRIILFTTQNLHYWVSMLLWLSPLGWKPLVLFGKTKSFEFWWFCDHFITKGNQVLQLWELYAQPTLFEFKL